MIIDNDSPPGSWKNEMEKLPWGYGQTQNGQVREALAEIRRAGLWNDADVLEREILALKRELEHVRSTTR